MNRRFNLQQGQGTFTFFNPLPASTVSEVLKRARVRIQNLREANEPAFKLEIKIGAGEEESRMVVRPGDKLTYSVEHAREIISAIDGGGVGSPLAGLAYWKDGESEQEAIHRALTGAVAHYNFFGANMLQSKRSRAGHTDEELERLRNGLYRSDCINLAKEELIQERLDALLQSEPTPARKRARGEEPAE